MAFYWPFCVLPEKLAAPEIIRQPPSGSERAGPDVGQCLKVNHRRLSFGIANFRRRAYISLRLGIPPPGEMLFAGDCADSGVLREQVTRLVNQAAVAMPADRIGREARDTIISALLRAEHYNYFLDCACGHSVLLHTNIPLECWE